VVVRKGCGLNAEACAVPWADYREDARGGPGDAGRNRVHTHARRYDAGRQGCSYAHMYATTPTCVHTAGMHWSQRLAGGRAAAPHLGRQVGLSGPAQREDHPPPLTAGKGPGAGRGVLGPKQEATKAAKG